MNRYRVEKVQQKYGMRWAVYFEGRYRFVSQTEDAAKKIAEKLNRIQERRLAAG